MLSGCHPMQINRHKGTSVSLPFYTRIKTIDDNPLIAVTIKEGNVSNGVDWMGLLILARRIVDGGMYQSVQSSILPVQCGSKKHL